MTKLKIAYGDSRFSKQWSNKYTTFEELCERFKTPRRTTETAAEYRKFAKPRRDSVKDVGGFVLGHLRGGRRKKGAVESRSGITLDADHATPGFVDYLEMLFPYKCVLYSTHSHTPDEPRIRLVIPLLREVSADEYAAVSRLVAAEIGIDNFDDSTYEAERLMYWASCPADGEYLYRVIDGAVLNPDEYLAKLSDWRDCSLYPTSSRQSAIIQREVKKQVDPLTKSGIIGAFCRAYSIEAAIAEFLPDVYEPSAMTGRYDYIPADSSAGVVIHDGGKFAYSHHASDPACNKLLNAFDLVAVHKFPDLEENDRFKAMSEFALSVDEVKRRLAEERTAEAEQDFEPGEDWKTRLKYDKQGKLANTLGNLLLILGNDEAFSKIKYNRLAHQIFAANLPWDRPHAPWRDADTAQLVSYIDKQYGTFSTRHYDIALVKVADDRSYHPIREYLDALPEWDEIPRLDTLLIDTLAAEDNEYVRAATRKTLVAAVARVYKPGIKYDSMLVLCGETGTGKSTLFSRLGQAWFSDSLSLSDMRDKTAAEKLQGCWIIEIGEMSGIRKMDVETVKSFLSRTDDKYRPSYGRNVESHPRQCIIVGTSNNTEGFLRDVTGNRRFLPVVTARGKIPPWTLDKNYIEQLWSEAIVMYKRGEELYLTAEAADYAVNAQREFMENDDREGLVIKYLETLLPESWNTMSMYERREYLSDIEKPDGIYEEGTVRRTQVSNIEIWCECFGKPKADIKKADSYEIEAIMRRINGWEKCTDESGKASKKRIPLYGVGRVYIRKNEN